MGFVLTDFQTIRPEHILSQQQTLDWIAKAHTAAQKEPSFYSEIREKLLRLGLGPDKIQQRGVVIRDCLHENWEEMETYNGCFGKRMQLFDKTVTNVFEQFYSEKSLPDHLIHVTCTGYVSPSGAQKIAAKSQTPITVTHAYHMGCYAAFPAIRMAMGLSSSVDVVHTEVCTLHMNPYLHDTGQLIVQTLFADGFIKYTVQKEGPGLKVVSLYEEIIPDSNWAMSWGCESWGLKMTIAKEVPVLIARALPKFLEKLGASSKAALFAIHPGGPKIIEQVAKILELEPWQIAHSRKILQTCGNMSSATLPHIWDLMLKDENIKDGTPIISLAFGPGLTLSGGVFACGR